MSDKLSKRLAALALLAATVAYAGWSFTVTIGDPDTSAEIATAILERPAVADEVLATAAPLLGSLEQYGVPAETATAIGETIVSDPRVIAAVADSIRDAHDVSLAATYGGVYLYIPGDALTAAGRDAAAAEGLDPAAMPTLTGTTVALPGAEHLGTAKRVASLWAWAAFCALGAAILGALAAADRSQFAARLASKVAISATVIVIAGWALTKFTETTTNPIAAAGGAAATVWRSRTTPTVTVIAVAAAIIWAVAVAAQRGALPQRRAPRAGRNLDQFNVGERVGEPGSGQLGERNDRHTTNSSYTGRG